MALSERALRVPETRATKSHLQCGEGTGRFVTPEFRRVRLTLTKLREVRLMVRSKTPLVRQSP